MASGKGKLWLYNTLTREKADFTPLDPGNVRMYVCGPTVYDYAHIGNARPAIVFDVLFRLLRHLYGEDHVTYVRNITDVDDKINARAARDYPELPLNEAIGKVTEKTAAQFEADVEALQCLRPTFEPRATENIDEMQRMIGLLIQRGHAYEAGAEVLFDVSSMPEYGQLSGRNLEEQLAGARVAVDAHKRNPADFVLWKLSSDEEPGWESPWGRGRPGWHIECSAMSERYLGEVFDIHGGGLDLIFPHHENELAQSRCVHGTQVMASVWMHNGFLQLEGRKMSKSEGNFVTIHELLATEKFGGRKWPGEVLRLAMLMTHYREPIDFSVARLEEAHRLWLSWRNLIRRHTPEDGMVLAEVVEALSDDLNTPLALSPLQKGLGSAADIAATLYFLGLANDDDFVYARLARADQKAGIRGAVERAMERAQSDDLRRLGLDPDGVASAIATRLAALNAKDFATADRIRADLLERGVQLMDSKNEAGERITMWEVKR